MRKAKASEKTLDSGGDSDGTLKLTGELFWKWKATHEAVSRCDAEVKLRTPLIEAMLEQHPELKKLINERTAYAQHAMTMRAEYNNVLKQLETHFGFPMTNVSIDDISGHVHRLDVGSPPPAQSAPKNGVNGHAVAPPDITETQPATPSAKKKPKKRK